MRYRLLMVLVLIIAILAVFWPAHNYDFLRWDDRVNIYENRYLNPVSLDSTFHFWKQTYKYMYIPLTYSYWASLAWLSLYIPAEPYGLNPHIFHSGNIMLHILNALLVFSILRILLTYGFGRKNDSENEKPEIDVAAGIGALVFALHPVQVEPVLWITGAKDLLYGLFSLFAIREYLKYAIASKRGATSSAKTRHYGLSFAAFILALLAKPAAVVLPLILLVLDRWGIKRTLKETAYSLAVWFMVAFLFTLLATSAQPESSDIVTAPLWARPFIAGDALAFYLYKVVIPVNLGIDYGRSPEYVMRHYWLYATWLLPFAIFAGIFSLKKREPFMVSAGIFTASLLPLLGFIPFLFQRYSTVADRYLYISMLGIALSLSWVIQNSGRKKILGWLAAVLLLFYGITDSLHVSVWQNESALYRHALKVNRESLLASTNLGVIMAREGKWDEVIEHYETVLKFLPNSPELHNNLGNALAITGQVEKAIPHFRKAIKTGPNDATYHYHLGLALYQSGDFALAAEHLSNALRIMPNYEPARKQLALATARMGEKR